jgi:low temperature requirement protein LtrA
MVTSTGPRRRLGAVLREEERVTPLELFFDLVFVLALTQCTALMADEPTWGGLAKGLLALAVLWWSWVGYAWLTSVVDPEEGAVRLAIFAAMAALLVVALCVPDAFGDLGLTFALAYAGVRAAHIALYVLASRDDPAMRKSVLGLAVSTAIGVGLLVGASFLDGLAQGALWAVAIGLDMLGPFLFGAEGWKLVPGHFAERHGLIVIIALGESIVAIGVGAEAGLTFGVGVAAVLGVGLAATLWWAYFDVVAPVSQRRLAELRGVARNTLGRDSFAYLHLPLIAGIELFALGVEEVVGHVDDELQLEAAVALCGGVALYLLAHVAFRLRTFGGVNRQRLAAAALCIACVPLGTAVSALAALAAVTAVSTGLIAYEAIRFQESRRRVRVAV